MSLEDFSMAEIVPKQQENILHVAGGGADGNVHKDNQLVEDATSDDLVKVASPEEPSEVPGTCEDPSHTEMAEKLAYYQRKARDSKRMVLRLKCQKDNELQSVTTQLLVLEGHLRREQKEIQNQLMQRDHIVLAQSQEIEKLRRNNRRLINRLKKFSEVFGDKDSENIEPRSKIGRLDSIDEDQYLSTDRNGCISPSLMLLPTPSHFPFTSPSKSKYLFINTNENKAIPISTLIELNNISNKYDDTPISYQPEIVNPDILNIRATTDRVFHKLPKVEKIKASPQKNKMMPNGGDTSTEVQTPNKKACSIVSTISRLLDEESDCTATAGSSNSEPSSPEATVKTVPPRVVRLARRLKESLTSSNLAMRFQNSPTILDTSLESNKQEETYHKSYLSDEHEVTSGYNSDAISDPDYDSLRSTKSTSKYEGEDDAKGQFAKNSTQTNEKDHDHLAEQKDINCLDNDPSCASQQLNEHMVSVRNVPRSRQSIKFLIDNNSDHMTENFEEFTLDSLESEENHQSERLHPDTNRDKENIHENPGSNNNGDKDMTAKEMDGGSTAYLPKISAVQVDSTTITKQYEQMLESSSNLIQKSILTPTRSMINHRSMLKPRDIKHRNKLRMVCTALTSLEENPSLGHKYYVKL